MRNLWLPNYRVTFFADGTIRGDLYIGPNHIRAILDGMGAVIQPLLVADVDLDDYVAAFEQQLDRLLQWWD